MADEGFYGEQVGRGLAGFLSGYTQTKQRKRRQKREDFLEQVDSLRLERELRAEEAAKRKETAAGRLTDIGRLFSSLREMGAPEEELKTGFRPSFEKAAAEYDPVRATAGLFAEPDLEDENKKSEAVGKKELARLEGLAHTIVTAHSDQKGGLTPEGKSLLLKLLPDIERYNPTKANYYRGVYLPETKGRKAEAKDRIEKRRGELEALGYSPEEIEEAIQGQFGVNKPITQFEVEETAEKEAEKRQKSAFAKNPSLKMRAQFIPSIAESVLTAVRPSEKEAFEIAKKKRTVYQPEGEANPDLVATLKKAFQGSNAFTQAQNYYKAAMERGDITKEEYDTQFYPAMQAAFPRTK